MRHWLALACEATRTVLGDEARIVERVFPSEPRRGPGGVTTARLVLCAGTGYGTVYALGAGADEEEAARALAHALVRPEGPDLYVKEVAAVLGRNPARVRQLAQAGKLPATGPCNSRRPARFRPLDVYALLCRTAQEKEST